MNTVKIVVSLALCLGSLQLTAARRNKKTNKDTKRRSRELQPDPVHGAYSEWFLYSLCNTLTCTETWTRYCNNPRPQNGGRTCQGDSFKKERCRDEANCVTEDPTEDKIKKPTESSAQWSRWGPCSVSCGIGIRTRTMLPCKDKDNCDIQEQPCVKRSCEPTYGYGDWSDWGPCESCVQSRSHTCTRTDICGDKTETETRQCEDCSLDTETMTACQALLHEHTRYNGRSGWKVECTKAGEFRPRQCDADNCWCVEGSSGGEVLGTRHSSHMTGVYNCYKLSKMPHCRALYEVGKMGSVASDYSPQCDDQGNFRAQQMSDDIQWCVYRDGLEVPGTRVSINDALACDPAHIAHTKCEADSSAECSATTGVYLPMQCYNGGEYKVCRCVYSNGLTKDSTEMTSELPACSTYADLSLTKCQAKSQSTSYSKCLPSGEYAPEYCNQDVCFCIDEDGMEIAGSSFPANAKRYVTCQEIVENGNNPDIGTEETSLPTFPLPGSSTSTLTTPYTTGPIKTWSKPITSTPTSSSMSQLLVSTTEGLEELNLTEYSEWSGWSECSADCGAGYRSKTKHCLLPSGGCLGPDIATLWDACNDFPCITAEITRLDYEWSEDGQSVTVTCTAAGVPIPYVVIRDGVGHVAEENQIEDTASNSTTVKHVLSPRVETLLRCIATGEAQHIQPITIRLEEPSITSFTVSSPALYLGQEATIRCSIGGLPRPDVRLTQNNQIVQASSSEELVWVIKPETDSEYSCSAIYEGEVVATTAPLTVLVIDPCLGVQCPEHASCVVEQDGSTTCLCDVCSENEVETASPLCGSNCVTYLSPCSMKRAGCLGSLSLTSLQEGTCSELAPPTATTTCPAEGLLEGAEVLFQCEAGGLWQSVVWTKDGVTVGRGKHYSISAALTTDSGEYTCTVSGCGGTTTASCAVQVKKRDTELCVQYGAGHFEQFSGAGFTYPGLCHYVFAMDCHYGSFYIYTGTSQCGTEKMPLAYASSVTVYVGWDAVVLLRGFDVNEFGVMKHLNAGTEMTYNNFRIWREDDLMRLTHPAANFTLSWDGLTVLSLSASKSYSGQLCGLCGDVGTKQLNEIEDPQAHGASYEVDRYDRCNVADIPEDTCKSDRARHEAEAACFSNLHNEVLSKCHGVVPVTDYMDSCVYDSCGVKWLRVYHTGLCNVLNAYAIVCQEMGVDTAGWRTSTPCSQKTKRYISYQSKKRRRKKRYVGVHEFDIMLGGD